jgi:hypothetical protein
MSVSEGSGAEFPVSGDLTTRRRMAEMDVLVEMSHPTIDWTVKVLPEFVGHYLDDDWKIEKVFCTTPDSPRFPSAPFARVNPRK